jgi:anhydro-N-acetylmuramic acid kinase
MRVAGIMSGTSLDGIDVALVDIHTPRRREVRGFLTTPYPEPVRAALLAMSNTTAHTADVARMHFLLPELYAGAVKRACRASGIKTESVHLVGCHGQTIFHQGEPAPYLTRGRPIAATLQIGDGAVLAERLGTPVVSDFRPADIAAGGKGAPLVPWVDYLLFRDAKRGRIALNLGGIGNITAIPPSARPEDVRAFDTGPGNMVIDQLVAIHTGGRRRFDRGGRIAASGHVNRALLDDLLGDPFYRRKPPKTAGREQYGQEFIERLRASGLPLADLIATATALTAASVAVAIHRFAGFAPASSDVIVSGGGAHNPRIMATLQALLPEVAVRPSSDFGIDVDAKEAIAFALLAYETWHRRPANLPSATGARHPAVLGKVSLPGDGPE